MLDEEEQKRCEIEMDTDGQSYIRLYANENEKRLEMSLPEGDESYIEAYAADGRTVWRVGKNGHTAVSEPALSEKQEG